MIVFVRPHISDSGTCDLSIGDLSLGLSFFLDGKSAFDALGAQSPFIGRIIKCIGTNAVHELQGQNYIIA